MRWILKPCALERPDYLVKTLLQCRTLLERSIRYALQRKRAAAMAAFEQARLAAFGAEIGLALTRRDSLEAIMERCTRAMVQYLNAAVAQISTFDGASAEFNLLAMTGPLIDGGNAPEKLPTARFDIAGLSEGKPMVIKHALNDPRLSDQDRLRQKGVVSYAAYPLVVEEKLVGLMSVFSQQAITEQITLEMGSVAHGLALCIEQKRSEHALGVSESKYRTVVESIKEVIFQLDEFGNWTFLNPAWTAYNGLRSEANPGHLFPRVYLPG